MGIMQTLFGGATQDAKSTPVDLTPAQFSAIRDPFTTALSGVLSNGGGPQYQGPLTTPIGANESSILGGLMTEGQPRNDLINSTLNGNFLPGQPGGNPFLDATIRAAQRPTLEGLTETLDRSLPGKFTQAGQFVDRGNLAQGSSAFDRAAAIATRGAANALGDIATNISYQGYNDERTRQQQAVQLSQQEVDTTLKNLQAQALPRLIQEQGLERGIDLFKTHTQELMQVLSILAGVTAPTIANQSESHGESTGGIVPGISGLLKAASGGVLSGGSAGGSAAAP